MTKLMCFLSDKAFKPILVVAQNTIMNLEISIMLCKLLFVVVIAKTAANRSKQKLHILLFLLLNIPLLKSILKKSTLAAFMLKRKPNIILVFI